MYDLIVVDLGLACRVIALLFAGTFVIRYNRRNWRSLPEGRHLMGFSLVVVAFNVLGVINSITAWLDADSVGGQFRPAGDYLGRDEITVLLYAAVAYFMYRQTRLLDDAFKDQSGRVTGGDVDDEVGAR